MPISRGFRGRRRDDSDAARIPPGQYLTDDFPVLSAGPTPHHPLTEWSFAIRGAVDTPLSWSWEEFNALPSETVTVDIHCVTKWSKLDTVWTGVSLDVLLDGVDTSAEYVLAFSDGGYTTNLPLEDLRDGKAWVAYRYDEEPLDSEQQMVVVRCGADRVAALRLVAVLGRQPDVDVLPRQVAGPLRRVENDAPHARGLVEHLDDARLFPGQSPA